MSITSSDLSVLYEFQWLIGLFRYSISPLKQRPTTGAVGTDSEKDRRKSFSDLGKRLSGLSFPAFICLFLHSSTGSERARLIFMTGHWSPCLGPLIIHRARTSRRPGTSCLSAERWTWNFNPRSPGVLGWVVGTAAGLTRLRALAETG